jgi:dihydrofolate reductase
MGKIVISENVTLDGVIQDATGAEGFRLGGWFGQVGNKDRDAWARSRNSAGAGRRGLLLGRRSYEFFAARWPSPGGRVGGQVEHLPKYVVSLTLEDPDWNNSTVLKGDVVNAVSKLRQKVNGDIVIYASFQLVHTLLDHVFVDELRLVIYPFVLGAGESLFVETSAKKPMRLVDTRTVGDGLAFLAYQPVRDA